MVSLINPSRVGEERTARIVLSISGGLIVLISCLFIVSIWFIKEKQPSPPTCSKEFRINHERLGRGPLSLFCCSVPLSLESLMQELSLLGKNTRPDRTKAVLIGLKSGFDKKEVALGDRVFLSCGTDGYQFVEEESDLSLKPCQLELNRLLVCVNGPSLQEQMISLPLSSFLSHSIHDEPFVQALKKGKLWKPDLFLQECGGDEYKDLSLKHRIQLNEGGIFFLAEGDVMWWDGDEWHLGESKSILAPLAQVVDTHSKGLVFQVWDTTGYQSGKVELPLHDPGILPSSRGELISSARVRSSSEITCQLGKRRFVLREGDWWLKNEDRWRLLRTASELEAFIFHELMGELFIFDKIETGKGKLILKGKSFDAMRVHVKPFCFTFNTEKKTVVRPNSANQWKKNKA